MSARIDWKELEDISERLSQLGQGGGSARDDDLQKLKGPFNNLLAAQDWGSIVRLRSLLTPVIARDSIGVHETLQRLSDQAILAAKKTGDTKELAHLLGANGHNLHRRGLHQQALNDFTRSYKFYDQVGESFESLKNYYMTSLCHRALGNIVEAKKVLEEIISLIDHSDPWYGNPLQVLGWIERDNGHIHEAEGTFWKALDLHRQSKDSDILVAGTLADLGEVIGLQDRYEEARSCFVESLEIINKHQGQYDRQEARTETKLAELCIRERKYDEALNLLDHADDLVSAYGAYKDQLWKIELLRAVAKFRQGNINGALRRMRSAKTIYDELGLPTKEFIRHTVNRLKSGSGLISFKKG